jgi:HSP20 family protein
MSLVRYEPFSLLDRFNRELNRLGLNDPFFNESVTGEDNSNIVTSHWRPAVDIKEEENRFLIQADVPGVDPKDIEITMENGVLTIRGERAAEARKEGEGYTRVERVRGSFYRRFSLPDTSDAERIEAQGKNGVLEVVIPKKEKAKPKRITIK